MEISGWEGETDSDMTSAEIGIGSSRCECLGKKGGVLGACELKGLVNLRVTHRTASVPILESVSFKAPDGTLGEVRGLEGVEECALIQTCNRVEVYASVSNGMQEASATAIAEYWRGKAGFSHGEFYRYLKVSFGLDVVLHFMRVASGLDSMVVGEEQVLGQVRGAYVAACRCGTVGKILRMVFEGGIKAGRAVRARTGISKGSVSLGSIAANTLEQALGSLEGKKILVLGAGNIGTLVGKALSVRRPALIFVANRTYERAVRLSEILSGHAARLDSLPELLASVDAAVVATSAPHIILRYETVSEAVRGRTGGRLLIVDLSQPRNVDERVADLPGVEMRNIDNLRMIADENLKKRLREAEKAEQIVRREAERMAGMEEEEERRERVSSMILAGRVRG